MTTSSIETAEDVSQKQVITEVHCYACGHNWLPRTTKMPAVCPRCKRFKWKKEDWEASKALKQKRKGGKKHVSKSAHLGPGTEKFLQQHERHRKET